MAEIKKRARKRPIIDRKSSVIDSKRAKIRNRLQKVKVNKEFEFGTRIKKTLHLHLH